MNRLRFALGLLAMLSPAIYWSAEVDERTSIGRAALETARACGDAESLSRVLSRAWALFETTKPYVRELSAYSEEALALAQPGTSQYMEALENLCAGSAVIGDTERSLEYLRQLKDAAMNARLSGSIWRSMCASAMLAVHVGDVDRAEAEAGAALTFAQHHGLSDRAMGTYGAIMYNVRRAQGRSGELVPLLEELVESQPELPVWRVALAGACYFAGRADEVREQYDWLAADGCTNVKHDVEYPVTMCGLARLAPYVDADDETCRLLYDALAPFAGLMNYTGTSIADASDIGLACVADQLGWHEIADGHYRDSIALADRATAVPYGCHYRYEWARSLESRGDTDRAAEVAAEALALAEGRNMDGADGYVAWCADLLARLS